jgi:MSHA biogenesis protein MshQ
MINAEGAVRGAAVERRTAAGRVAAALARVVIALAMLLCALARAQPVLVSVSTTPAPASSPVSSITVNAPAGIAAGDVMLAQVVIRGGTSAVVGSVPTGWTLVLRTNRGTALAQAVYVKVTGASEPASYTWTFSPNARATAAIAAYRGVDNDVPVNASAGQGNAASATVTAPAVTTTVANTRVVSFFGAANGNLSFTPPAGTVERYDVGAGTGAGPNGASVSSADADAAAVAAGTVAARNATASGSAENVGQSVALTPSAGGSTSPSSFNVFEPATAAGAADGVIRTKVSGQAFDLDLVALDAARTAVLSSFNGTVSVELLDAGSDSGALDAASGCRSSWSTIRSLGSPVFGSADNGRIRLAGIVEPGAWRKLRVKVSYGPPGGATVAGCSTDAFAVRPAGFGTPLASDADWRTAGGTRTLANASAPGGIVHAAGRPFRVSFAALDANGAVVPSYDGAPSLVFAGCVLPAACTTASAASLAAPLAVAGGVASTDAATYAEVGAFAAYAQDASFAAVDAGDGSDAAQRTIQSASATIGRFVPDRYLLALTTVPEFAPGQGTACTGSASSNYTWIGQPFAWRVAPVVTVTAQNAAGSTTGQAEGSLFTLGASGVTLAWSSNAPAAAPFVASGQTVTVAGTGGGAGTIAFGTGAVFRFTRPMTPVSPFGAVIGLAVDVADATDSAVSGNGAIGSVASLTIDAGGAGIAFEGGNAAGANHVAYGRLQLASAHGDSRRELWLPYEVQAWSGSAWTRQQRENCLQPAATTIAMSGWGGELSACDVSVVSVGRVARGQGLVRLGAPLAGRTGGVDLAFRLGSASGSVCTAGASVPTASAGLGWLQGPWTSAPAYTSDPAGRASFGRMRVTTLIRREIF